MSKFLLSSRLVAVASAALSAFSFAAPARAQTAALTHSQAGYYRLMVGSTEVIALSDGTLPLDTVILASKDPADTARLLAKSFLKSTVETSVNAFLFKTGNKTVLVDAGTAELFGPTLNKLPAALRSVGVTPEQITDILVTHIHTDHTGGLMQGTARAFPNAVVHVERKEVAYWLDPANKATARADLKIFFDQAALKFKPYVDSGQVVPFDGEVTLFPGLTSKPAPGHTPGHTMYVLQDSGDKVVFWGDLVHVAAVQFPNPGVTIQYDVDPVAAEATRRKLFAEAAQQGYLVAPAHVSFPGFGHVSKGAPTVGPFVGSDRLYKEVGEYRYYPVTYNNGAVSPP